MPMQYVWLYSTVCMHSIGLTLLRLSECCIFIQYRVNPDRIEAWGIRPPRGVPGLGYVCGKGSHTFFLKKNLFFNSTQHKVLRVKNLII
jgi:hypothetical protein